MTKNTNAFATAATKRAAAVAAKRASDLKADANAKVTSEANIAKLQAFATFCAVEDVAKLFTQANVDADTFNDAAIYSIAKLQNVAQCALKVKKLNAITNAIVRTAINAHNASDVMTLDDAKNACSAHRKIADNRKSIVVQNEKHIDDSTINAQHRSSLDALLATRVIRETVAKDNSKAFQLNKSNAVTQKLAAMFEMQLS